MLLTPNKIYEDFRNNNLDKNTASKLLISLIDNSKNNVIRANCVEVIEKIGYKDQKIFKFLENLLISDTNKQVRLAAINAIRSNFLNKALPPMIWAIQNESSITCLKIINATLIEIIESLVEREDYTSKSIIIKEIKNIPNLKFKDNLNDFIVNGRIESFANQQLAQILIDHIAITFLKKQFQKIDFEVENGVVKKLDLRFRYLNISSEFIPSFSPILIPELEDGTLSIQSGSLKPFNSLKELYLISDSLKTLPKWIKTLSSLESLLLHRNKLATLPNWIGELFKLKKLGISGNNISILPKSLKNLKLLEYLALSDNNIESLPEWLGSFSSLKKLWLDNNHLISFPESLKSLTSLKSLYLGKNNLKTLPEIFNSLPSLKALWLEENNLISLPESIGSLNSLEYLCLNDNMLTSLPESICHLNTLKYLHLNNNRLKIIPNSIKSLSSLKELWLKGNNIKEIAEWVKELEKKGLSIYL